MNVQLEEVLKARKEYGDAWLQTGIWIAKHHEALGELGPVAFCVTMIYNKLVRAAHSPENPDHMVDALGYLELMMRHFKEAVDERNANK